MELFHNKEILSAINFDIICKNIFTTMENHQQSCVSVTGVIDSDILVSNSGNNETNKDESCLEPSSCSSIPLLNKSATSHSNSECGSPGSPGADRTSAIVSGETKVDIYGNTRTEVSSELLDGCPVYAHENSETNYAFALDDGDVGSTSTSCPTISADKPTVAMSVSDVLVDKSSEVKKKKHILKQLLNTTTHHVTNNEGNCNSGIPQKDIHIKKMLSTTSNIDVTRSTDLAQEDNHLTALLSDTQIVPNIDVARNNDTPQKDIHSMTLQSKTPNINITTNNDIAQKDCHIKALVNKTIHVPNERNSNNDRQGKRCETTENGTRSTITDTTEGSEGNGITGYGATFFDTDGMMDYESDSEKDTISVEVLLSESKVDCVNKINKIQGMNSSSVISVKCEARVNDITAIGEGISASDTEISDIKTANERSNKTQTGEHDNKPSELISECGNITCNAASDKTYLNNEVINTPLNSHVHHSSRVRELNVHESNTEITNSETSVHIPAVTGSESKAIAVQSKSQSSVDIETISCPEPSNRKKNEDIFHDKSAITYNTQSGECIKKPHIAVVFPLQDNAEERQESSQTNKEKGSDKCDSIEDFIEKYVTHQPTSGQNMSFDNDIPGSEMDQMFRTEIAEVLGNDTVISADDITCCDELWATLETENPSSSAEGNQAPLKKIKKTDERSSCSFMTSTSAGTHPKLPSPEKRRPPNEVNYTEQSVVLKNLLRNEPCKDLQHITGMAGGGQHAPTDREQYQTGNVNSDSNMLRQNLINQFQLQAIRARSQQTNSVNNIQRATIVPQHRQPSGYPRGSMTHNYNQGPSGVANTLPPHSQQQYIRPSVPQVRFIQATPLQQLTSLTGYTSNPTAQNTGVRSGLAGQPRFQSQRQGQLHQPQVQFQNQITHHSLPETSQYSQGRQQYTLQQPQRNNSPNRFGNQRNTMWNQQTMYGGNQHRFLNTGIRNNLPVNQTQFANTAFSGSPMHAGYAPTLSDGRIHTNQMPLPGTGKEYGTSPMVNTPIARPMVQQRDLLPHIAAPSTQEYSAEQLLDSAQQSETLPDLSWIVNFNL